MKFILKDYKTTKSKNYIKTNHIFFFVNGINLNCSDWIKTEQTLKDLNFSYYKVLNKVASKILSDSIYNKIKPIIHGVTFFTKFQSSLNMLEKKIVIKKFEPLLFNILALKFNSKIYSINQFKSLNSLDYYENKLFLYQFIITNLKTYYKF